MINLTPLFNAIIAVAAAAAAAFLVPWLKGRLNAERRDTIAYWLEVAVAAAEEQFKGGSKGEEKMAYVVNFLADKGFIWSDKETAALINSTVWQLINCWREQ